MLLIEKSVAFSQNYFPRFSGENVQGGGGGGGGGLGGVGGQGQVDCCTVCK